MPLARKVGLNPGDVVLDGDPAPLPEKWQSPQFSAHVYCGQTAGWITMPLGMEIGSAQATLWIVLDGDPALPPPKVHSPQFSAHVCCSQTAGWIKMPLGTKVGLGQATLCYMGTQPPPQKRGHTPNFRPMSIVAKRSPISATAEQLFKMVTLRHIGFLKTRFLKIVGS